MKISNQRFLNHTIFTLLFLLSLFLSPLAAQHLTAYRGNVQNAYDYWFYVPGVDAAPGAVSVPAPALYEGCVWDQSEPLQAVRPKPLVIFLHGASLCGRNLSRVRTYGTLEALEKGLKLDAYVLAPQNPGDSWNPAKVNRLVDWAIDRYAIDTTRIYVLGMSLGGYGTIDYTATYPDRVAAAVAMCGGGTVGNYGRLSRVPLCIIHGTGDKAVSWQASQNVVDGIKATGDTSRLIYRLLPKRTHGDLARYFYVTAVYEWLFRHSLTDPGRPVDRQYSFPFSDTENVYRTLEKPKMPMIVEDSKANAKSDTDDSTRGVHIVRAGDSLSRIAQKYHTNVARLCRINNLKRTSTLRLGQKIRY